jgi:hypothetical protein
MDCSKFALRQCNGRAKRPDRLVIATFTEVYQDYGGEKACAARYIMAAQQARSVADTLQLIAEKSCPITCFLRNANNRGTVSGLLAVTRAVSEQGQTI